MSENAQQRRPERDADAGEPDVLLDIPKVSVDSIRLAVDGLDADISLRARLANLLQLDAGVRVHLRGVELDIDGAHAEAQLRVRLEQLVTLLGRALDTIDNNPQVIESLAQAGGGALDDVNRSAQQVAAGATEVSALAQHARVRDDLARRTDASGGDQPRVRPARPVSPSAGPPVSTPAPGPSGAPTGGRGDREQPEGAPSGGGPSGGGPAGAGRAGGGPAGRGESGQGGRAGGGQAGGGPSGGGPTGGGAQGGGQQGGGGGQHGGGQQGAGQYGGGRQAGGQQGGGGGGQAGGGVAGGAQAAAQSAAQLAEQAGESLRQAGRSVWEAIQGGIAQHRQQGRDDQ
ncbi:hypothetical protein [Micromonospora sp. NPDC049107]|uniref:hypothetical protein n=1 Tax=Micromonospora sp. NPDC049107 TaxID=3154349 RepID=UPI0033F5A204